MYDNIGKKIKMLAQIILIVESLALFITGIVLCFEYEDGIYFLISVFGPVIVWVSSWFMYGFGEMVDKICAIEKKTTNKYTYTDSLTMEIPSKEEETILRKEEIYHEHENYTESNESVKESEEFLKATVQKTDDKYVYITCPKCNENIFLHKNAKNAHCPYCKTGIDIEFEKI